MKGYGERATEFLSWPALDLSPANYVNNATPYTIGPITAQNFRRYIAKVKPGVLTGTAVVSLYWQGSNTSTGNYANLTSISVANAQVSANVSNNPAMTIEVRSDQLNAGNQYLQAVILVANNSAFLHGEVIALDTEYSPGSQFNNLTQLPVANQIVD